MRQIGALPHLKMLLAQEPVAGDDGFAGLSRSQTLEYFWAPRMPESHRPRLCGDGGHAVAEGLAASCKFVDDHALSLLPRFPSLRALMPMDVSDDGFRHVGRCERLEELWCMYCRDTGDTATEHVSGLKLKTYYAGYTQITDRSLDILSRMTTLERIELHGCNAHYRRRRAPARRTAALAPPVDRGLPQSHQGGGIGLQRRSPRNLFDDMSAFPDWLVPMAATLTQERFAGPDWRFERKFDGIRLIAFKQGADVRLYSRNRLPQHLPNIAGAIAQLPVQDAILDGEITWDRQSAYHVFDVLWLDGRASTAAAARRATGAARRTATPRAAPPRRGARRRRAMGARLREGWEGVIAKRRESLYEHRRSKSWLKMKCELTHDFIVGGFTDPQGRASVLARCWSATTTRESSRSQVKSAPVSIPNCCSTCGVGSMPSRSRRRRLRRARGLPRLRAHWVRPEIVVSVGFIEWTVHGKLRHPRLLAVVS